MVKSLVKFKSKDYLGIMASDITNNHTNWQSALWLGLKIPFQSWIQPACQQLLHSCNTWLPAWTDVRRKNTSQEAKRVKLYHAMVITNLLRYWTCNCSNQEKRRIKMKYGSISMMILPLLSCTASHLRLENYPNKTSGTPKQAFLIEGVIEKGKGLNKWYRNVSVSVHKCT